MKAWLWRRHFVKDAIEKGYIVKVLKDANPLTISIDGVEFEFSHSNDGTCMLWKDYVSLKLKKYATFADFEAPIIAILENPDDVLRGAKEQKTNSAFVEVMDVFQKEVHGNARNKGFWDDYDEVRTNRPEMLVNMDLAKYALMISELGEGVEGVRKPGHCDKKGLGHLSKEAEELADTVIRIMDYCEQKGINLGSAIVDKHAYNRTRERLHGKKA